MLKHQYYVKVRYSFNGESLFHSMDVMKGSTFFLPEIPALPFLAWARELKHWKLTAAKKAVFLLVDI